jgi:hypothetical protein
VCRTYLERVATIRFSINHLHDLLVYRLASLVSISPVIAGPYAALSNEEVLRVVDILVGPRLYTVDDSRLEVDQHGPRYISGVVALVEEDILAVTAFCRKVLEVSILVDAVLLTQLLPELTANCYVSASVLRDNGSSVVTTSQI